MKKLAVLFLALGIAGTRADILFSDNFSYGDGPLVAVSGGIWRTHSGAPEDIQLIANRVHITQAKTEDIHALLEGHPYGPSSGTVLYASFEVEFTGLPSGAGTYFAHFKDGGNGFRCRIFAGPLEADPDRFRLGIAHSGNAASAWIPADLELNTTYTIVCRYDPATGASTLWVNPGSGLEAEATDDASGISVASFALRQALSGGNGMGTLQIGNLVVSTFMDDPLPPLDQPPAILSGPLNQTSYIGEKTEFNVRAGGTPPLSYQWLLDGIELEGAVNPTLIIEETSLLHAGQYAVRVSNPFGSIESEPAELAVETLVIPELAAIQFTARLENLRRPGDLLVSSSLTEYALHPGETIVIEATASDPRNRPVQLGLKDGHPIGIDWLAGDSSAPNVSGTLTFTPSANDAGQSHLIELEALNADGTSSVSWLIHVPTEAEQGIIINEFLANPTNNSEAPHYNPLGRETPTAPERIAVEDEYIEILNAGSDEVDLTGWTLHDAAGRRHVFASDTLLPPYGALVIYGGETSGSTPNLPGLHAPASEGSAGLSLNNNGDSIILRNSTGQLVARVIYSGTLPSDGSLTRHPDWNGAFVGHATISHLPVSPGLDADGLAFGAAEGPEPEPEPEPPLLRIVRNGQQVVVRWNNQPRLTYSVLGGDSLQGPFHTLAENLAFEAGEAEFLDAPMNGGEPRARFYQVIGRNKEP